MCKLLLTKRLGYTFLVQEIGDNFELVALVDEELLALGRVEHLLSVFGDQSVEEGIEFICWRGPSARLLGTQDAAQSLGFLPPGACMAADLDKAISLWDVQGVVTNFAQEDCIHLHIRQSKCSCKQMIDDLRLRRPPDLMMTTKVPVNVGYLVMLCSGRFPIVTIKDRLNAVGNRVYDKLKSLGCSVALSYTTMSAKYTGCWRGQSNRKSFQIAK